MRKIRKGLVSVHSFFFGLSSLVLVTVDLSSFGLSLVGSGSMDLDLGDLGDLGFVAVICGRLRFGKLDFGLVEFRRSCCVMGNFGSGRGLKLLATKAALVAVLVGNILTDGGELMRREVQYPALGFYSALMKEKKQ